MLQTDTSSETAEKIAEHADKVVTNVESVTTAAAQSTAETVKQSIDVIQQLQQKGINLLLDYGPKILVAILLLWIGFKLTNFLCRRIKKLMIKKEVDSSLVPFIVQIISIVLKILIILSVISIIGIPMTSFIALLGAMGLAIGMAFSGTLSNIAGGVVLLVLRPFKSGDYIAAQGTEGTVKSVQIFTTILITPDNKTISIPNGPLSSGTITNFSLLDTRRLDINLKLAHGVNTNQISKDVLDILNQDQRVLKTPEPMVVTNITESSITLSARVWVNTDDYWDVNWALSDKVYQYLYDNKIDVPIVKL